MPVQRQKVMFEATQEKRIAISVEGDSRKHIRQIECALNLYYSLHSRSLFILNEKFCPILSQPSFMALLLHALRSLCCFYQEREKIRDIKYAAGFDPNDNASFDSSAQAWAVFAKVARSETTVLFSSPMLGKSHLKIT